MPITQVPYMEGAADLREGIIAMTGVDTSILSAYNADSVVLPFGRGVTFSAAAGAATGTHENAGLILPTALNQVIRGVLIATDTIERLPGISIDANSNLGYPLRTASPTVPPSYVTKGIIAVKPVQNVVKGDPVFCVYAAGASRGLWGKDAAAAGATTATACPTTWEWLTTTAANSIGLIYLK